LNRKILWQHNEKFSKEIDKVGSITNQKNSGRCWLFAGLNTLRPFVIKKHNMKDFEFSQNYLAFWDKMEKANTFLETIIEFRDRDLMDRELMIFLNMPIQDGGYWENARDLIKKYGVVPKDIMPETQSSSNTGLMNKTISHKLRADAAKLRKMYADGQNVDELRKAKEKMLAETYRMLVLNLGEPVSQFQWRFADPNDKLSELKSYTPKSFYDEFVGLDLDEYVNIFNDSLHEYGGHYTIKLSKNIYDGHDINFANVPIETIKKIAMASIDANVPLLFAADVGYDQDGTLGIMAEDLYDYESIYKVDLTMSKADRAIYRNSVRGHGMVFTGVDVVDGKAVKWKVENSWGEERGSKGYWTLYDNWFDMHVYNIIAKKEFVPAEVLKIYEKPVVELPAWDPMLDMYMY
ncbi:MAG TPA: C1 family peptidase, partial [Sedimentisphaerales bacterium]|nr:C1 family peptidase [Sedimentisphaerales bacterium]